MLGKITIQFRPLQQITQTEPWDYVSNAWSTFEASSESGGLKFVYLQKSIILVLVVSLVLQGISNLIKAIYVFSGRLPAPEVKHG